MQLLQFQSQHHIILSDFGLFGTELKGINKAFQFLHFLHKKFVLTG